MTLLEWDLYYAGRISNKYVNIYYYIHLCRQVVLGYTLTYNFYF